MSYFEAPDQFGAWEALWDAVMRRVQMEENPYHPDVQRAVAVELEEMLELYEEKNNDTRAGS